MTIEGEPRIGVLYCGEMGQALCRSLVQGGITTLTTWEGRGNETRERALQSGAKVMPTLGDVFREANILISLVTPDAAYDVAQKCHVLAGSEADSKRKIFIDANSIDLARLESVRNCAVSCGLEFVDGAIRGAAESLSESGVLYLSGEQADLVSEILKNSLQTRVLGLQFGQATRMKLLLGAQAKTLSLMILQIAVLAEKTDLLPQFLSEATDFHPQVMAIFQRMLPTYAKHAERRIIELEGCEALANQSDAPISIISAASEWLRQHSQDFKCFEPIVGKNGDLVDLASLVNAFADQTKNNTNQHVESNKYGN